MSRAGGPVLPRSVAGRSHRRLLACWRAGLRSGEVPQVTGRVVLCEHASQQLRKLDADTAGINAIKMARFGRKKKSTFHYGFNLFTSLKGR